MRDNMQENKGQLAAKAILEGMSKPIPMHKRSKMPGAPKWPADARVNYPEAARKADEWLSIGLTKSEVKARIRKMVPPDGGPPLSARSVERVMARAKKIMKARHNMTTEELRYSAQNVYQSIISDDTAPFRDKVKAQERLDKLFGIQAPTQIQHSGNIGVSRDEAENLLKDEETVQLLDILAERLHQAREPGKN